MPATPVPAKPDDSVAASGADRRHNDALATREAASETLPEGRSVAPGRPRDGERRQPPAPHAAGSAASDRGVDADLLVDVPQLSVEALTLELDASLLLNRVKLDAKGLELGLYLKANFDRLAALTQSSAGTPHGDRDRQPVGAVRAPARTGREDGTNHGGDSHPVRERARNAVAHGGKAAGLTAAGLAGGALLKSRAKPSRKLPVPRRSRARRALPDAIAKRLP